MIKIPVSLWIAVPMLLALSGCEVSTCKGDECDFDSIFDEDGGTSDGGDDQDGGTGGDADGGESDGGGSGADGGGSTGESISLDEFCEAQVRIAAAWLNKFEVECACSDLSADERSKFVRNYFAYRPTADCAAAIQTQINAKTVRYDATKAKACADAFAATFKGPEAGCPAAGFDLSDIRVKQGNGNPAFVQIPVCREALLGQVAKNKPCTSSIECSAGLRCLAASGSGDTNKTCQDAVAESGSCVGRSDCADALTCAGNSSGSGPFCRAKDDLVDIGGNCSADQQCRAGLICDVPGSATCVTPKADVICKAP